MRNPLYVVCKRAMEYHRQYRTQCQFKQRNRSYRKLMKAGQLKSLDELMLIFNGPSFYVNNSENFLSIDCLDLQLPVQEFKDGVVWKLRVNEYNEEEGELFAEIIDYDFPLSKVTEIKQGLFYFYGIEKVKFRSLDTAGLLKSVILKSNLHQSSKRRRII